MTGLTVGTHVVFPNPLAPWCSHRGVVYDANPDDTYDLMSYSGRDVVRVPARVLVAVPVPDGPVEVGTRVVAIAIEHPLDLAPDPYARHALGSVVRTGPTHVGVRRDQHDEGVEDFPVDAVLAVPAAEAYVPRDGDEVVVLVGADGGARSVGGPEVEPVHGDVLGVSDSGEALVLTVRGQRMVDAALLAVDDRVEPGTWVVLSDGETGAVTGCEPFRTANRVHAWGYRYTVASPSGCVEELTAWSGQQFDGFLVADVEPGHVPGTGLPVGTSSQVLVRALRT